MKYSESDTTELKRELTDAAKGVIISFLNTRGGTLYVGINDDGTINPDFIKENRDDIDLKLGNWIQDAIYPISSENIEYDFNKNGVLVVKVREGKRKPYYLKTKGPKPSGVFKRVGSSTRNATEDEILMMIMQSHNYIFEDEVSEEQELTFKQLDRVFSDREINLTPRMFKTLGLKTSDNRYTNLGYILSDQSPIAVKFAEYDDHMNFRFKKTFTGSLLKILYDVEEQAEKANITSAIIDGSSFTRKETKSYPGASLREVILNAFCHADYFIRSNIKIEFYADHARIVNPGGVFNATIEDVMNGVQTYRNPKLVHVLDKLGLIENFGTGIPRTIDAYKTSGSDPVFESSDKYFLVTLPNLNYKKIDQINDQLNDQINDQLNDLSLSILRLVNSKPGINVPQMLEHLAKEHEGVTVDQIRNAIKRNLTKYIEHRGPRKSGGYYRK